MSEQHTTRMSKADIEALQLVCTAAETALSAGAISGLLQLRVAAAVGRVNALIPVEAACAK